MTAAIISKITTIIKANAKIIPIITPITGAAAAITEVNAEAAVVAAPAVASAVAAAAEVAVVAAVEVA